MDFNRKVSIKSLISTFVSKFPNIKLTAILLSSPEEVNAEELIGAVGVWLTILDTEKQQVFSFSLRNIMEDKL